ncbi:MAG: glucose-6-phosphate isomerase [Chlamydiales bacterium]|nr:glucose-6-phosphate isomerase [Chlamydiales bacterium]NCF70070.1 glucose-6-phosphate isomerase [Chlamydiales bacterium]
MKHDLATYPAYEQLSDLSNRTIEINASALDDIAFWDKHSVSFPGFTYFFPAQRLNAEVLSKLFDLSRQAKLLEKNQQIANGEIVNTIYGYESEDRPVLHTVIRDLKRNFGKHDKYWNFVDREWQKLIDFEKNFKKEAKFSKIFVVGIGGSELGAKAIYHALKAFSQTKTPLEFLANLDPDELFGSLQDENLSECLFIIISKSGSTLETSTNEEIVRGLLKQQGIEAKDHMLSITSENSALDRDDFLERFYMLDGVGGRFSVSSMVGAVPLSLALGSEVYREFIEGASAFDNHVLEQDKEEQVASLVAALISIWNRNFLSFPTNCVVPYSSALRFFPDHVQQLVMESNGKGVDKEGNSLSYESSYVSWGGIGCNSQHSYFQLLHQGSAIVPVDFIAFAEPQYGKDRVINGTSSQQKLLANLFAQSVGLAKGQQNPDNPNRQFSGNRPSSILLAKKLTPFVMGSLLAFYESKTVFEGLLWGINSFDQEGVQLGKTIAQSFIQDFKSDKKDFVLGQILNNILG